MRLFQQLANTVQMGTRHTPPSDSTIEFWGLNSKKEKKDTHTHPVRAIETQQHYKCSVLQLRPFWEFLSKCCGSVSALYAMMLHALLAFVGRRLLLLLPGAVLLDPVLFSYGTCGFFCCPLQLPLPLSQHRERPGKKKYVPG